MVFLQPFILFGLPLILLPVIIHLINRQRYRRQNWAAMQFLMAANKRAVSHAKLRQFLILLFRVLAVLALLLFISRPMVGGWLGWALSPAPDAIVLLLDRSASMSARVPGLQSSRLDQAVEKLAEAASHYENASHLVLIESAGLEPQELSGAAALKGLSLTAPTDTAADLPSMLRRALEWLVDNRAGAAEIWIASDLQSSNWRPEDDRWKDVVDRLNALPQPVRLRLLAFTERGQGNAGARLLDMTRRRTTGQGGELRFLIDLYKDPGSFSQGESLPIQINHQGARTQVETALESPALRWRHTLPLNREETSGWGGFSLPEDGAPADNRIYFAYGPEQPARISLIGESQAELRYYQWAAGPSAREGGSGASQTFWAPDEAHLADWSDKTLLVWQGPLPPQETADRIRRFVEEGGVAFFLPPETPGERRFQGVGWGPVQSAADSPFAVSRWEEDEGPLRKTSEGASLPVAELEVFRRQAIVGASASLASFQDDAPFLVRQTLGRGEVYFCAALAKPDWSTLSEGLILVPMTQRMLYRGTARLSPEWLAECGRLKSADRQRQWTPVAPDTDRDIRLHAGVYRSEDRFLAVNRPEEEDRLEMMDPSLAPELFGELPFQSLEDSRVKTQALQGEVWRLFLAFMLAALLLEGFLILPQRER